MRAKSRLHQQPRIGPSAFHRLRRIHELLASGRPVNAVALAHEFESSARTIKRDIESLRDMHGAPIKWDATAHSYRYTAPFDLLSGLRLDAEETLAIVLASRTFAVWGESPLGRALTSAFGKVSQFTSDAISLPMAEIANALYEPEQTSATDNEHRHFAQLLQLVVSHQETEITYQKPSSTQPECRRIRPLHLACLDHRWVLVAEDVTKRAWRNFLLSRIQTVGSAGVHFKHPSREKIWGYLSGSLGRFASDAQHEVRIRFDAQIIPYLQEKPWHASQTLTPLPGGSTEATYLLNNLIDIRRRVLACGSLAEVVSPPELRLESWRTSSLAG